jgi:hypothetical protein
MICTLSRSLRVHNHPSDNPNHTKPHFNPEATMNNHVSRQTLSSCKISQRLQATEARKIPHHTSLSPPSPSQSTSTTGYREDERRTIDLTEVWVETGVPIHLNDLRMWS